MRVEVALKDKFRITFLGINKFSKSHNTRRVRLRTLL